MNRPYMNMQTNFGIIDTHVHFWDLTLPGTTWPTPEWKPLYRSFRPNDFIKAAKPAGVTSCIFVEAGTAAEAARFMKETAASDVVAGIAPYIALTNPQLARDLDAWMQNPKVKAVRDRIEGNPDRNFLTQSKILEGLRQVAERGLVFEFLISSYHLPDIAKVYERVPELKGVIEHMGKPDIRSGSDRAVWARDMKSLAANTPVLCKLSLSPRVEDLSELVANPGRGWRVDLIKPYAAELLEQFGANRLMWGSDYPLIFMESDYSGTLSAMQQALGSLPENDERCIFRTTALRVYGIE